MKKIIHSLWACTLAALLCSCAATSVKNIWKSPDSKEPVGKTAVLAVDERGLVRQGFENRFVKALTGGGGEALVTFDILTLAEIKQDKVKAAEQFRAGGAESLIILRLIEVASRYREVQPGSERFAANTIGFESMGWYDYYSVGFSDLSPTYGNLKQWVYIEASLYDLKTEKRVWSGLTETTLKENMDRVAEMDPVVEKLVAAMRKDGVVR